MISLPHSSAGNQPNANSATQLTFSEMLWVNSDSKLAARLKMMHRRHQPDEAEKRATEERLDMAMILPLQAAGWQHQGFSHCSAAAQFLTQYLCLPLGALCQRTVKRAYTSQKHPPHAFPLTRSHNLPCACQSVTDIFHMLWVLA